MTAARVEHEADLRRPGRTGYRITGSTASQVQDSIDTLERTVDPSCGGAFGIANFIGPISVETDAGWQWCALGEVIVEQVEFA